jgi:DNA-directed RNA polymerase specialized sigma subunit
MKMVIDVYEYGRGGKCVCMFRYTYAGIRIINKIEKEYRHRSRVTRIPRAPCQRYVLNSQENKKENKKVVMSTKPNTNHAALATQVGRQVEKQWGKQPYSGPAPV